MGKRSRSRLEESPKTPRTTRRRLEEQHDATACEQQVELPSGLPLLDDIPQLVSALRQAGLPAAKKISYADRIWSLCGKDGASVLNYHTSSHKYGIAPHHVSGMVLHALSDASLPISNPLSIQRWVVVASVCEQMAHRAPPLSLVEQLSKTWAECSTHDAVSESLVGALSEATTRLVPFSASPDAAVKLLSNILQCAPFDKSVATTRGKAVFAVAQSLRQSIFQMPNPRKVFTVALSLLDPLWTIVVQLLRLPDCEELQHCIAVLEEALQSGLASSNRLLDYDSCTPSLLNNWTEKTGEKKEMYRSSLFVRLASMDVETCAGLAPRLMRCFTTAAQTLKAEITQRELHRISGKVVRSAETEALFAGDILFRLFLAFYNALEQSRGGKEQGRKYILRSCREMLELIRPAVSMSRDTRGSTIVESLRNLANYAFQCLTAEQDHTCETASAAFEALSSILLMEPDAVDHDTMLSALLVNDNKLDGETIKGCISVMCTFLRQASVVRAAPEAVGKILNKIVKQNVSVQGLRVLESTAFRNTFRNVVSEAHVGQLLPLWQELRKALNTLLASSVSVALKEDLILLCLEFPFLFIDAIPLESCSITMVKQLHRAAKAFLKEVGVSCSWKRIGSGRKSQRKAIMALQCMAFSHRFLERISLKSTLSHEIGGEYKAPRTAWTTIESLTSPLLPTLSSVCASVEKADPALLLSALMCVLLRSSCMEANIPPQYQNAFNILTTEVVRRNLTSLKTCRWNGSLASVHQHGALITAAFDLFGRFARTVVALADSSTWTSLISVAWAPALLSTSSVTDDTYLQTLQDVLVPFRSAIWVWSDQNLPKLLMRFLISSAGSALCSAMTEIGHPNTRLELSLETLDENDMERAPIDDSSPTIEITQKMEKLTSVQKESLAIALRIVADLMGSVLDLPLTLMQSSHLVISLSVCVTAEALYTSCVGCVDPKPWRTVLECIVTHHSLRIPCLGCFANVWSWAELLQRNVEDVVVRKRMLLAIFWHQLRKSSSPNKMVGGAYRMLKSRVSGEVVSDDTISILVSLLKAVMEYIGANEKNPHLLKMCERLLRLMKLCLKNTSFEKVSSSSLRLLSCNIRLCYTLLGVEDEALRKNVKGLIPIFTEAMAGVVHFLKPISSHVDQNSVEAFVELISVHESAFWALSRMSAVIPWKHRLRFLYFASSLSKDGAATDILSRHCMKAFGTLVRNSPNQNLRPVLRFVTEIVTEERKCALEFAVALFRNIRPDLMDKASSQLRDLAFVLAAKFPSFQDVREREFVVECLCQLMNLGHTGQSENWPSFLLQVLAGFTKKDDVYVSEHIMILVCSSLTASLHQNFKEWLPSISVLINTLKVLLESAAASNDAATMRAWSRIIEQFESYPKKLKKYAPLLLMDLIGVHQRRDVTQAAKQELLSAVYVLFSLAGEHELEMLYNALPISRQSVLKDLRQAYHRNYRFSGQA